MEGAIAIAVLMALVFTAVTSIALSVVILRVIGSGRRNKGWIYLVGGLAAALAVVPAVYLGGSSGLEASNAHNSIGGSAFLGAVIATACIVAAAAAGGGAALLVIPDAPLPWTRSARAAALWSIGALAVVALSLLGWRYATPDVADEVRALCARGVLPKVRSVSSSGLVFIPSPSCMSRSVHPACRTASDYAATGPEFLLRGFEFVEFHGSYPRQRRPPSADKSPILRLSFATRPDPRCQWFDDEVAEDTTAAIAVLERRGIPTVKCIAVDLTARPRSDDYAFTVTLEGSRPDDKRIVRATLRQRNAVHAEVWAVSGGGASCDNAVHFEELLRLVKPR